MEKEIWLPVITWKKGKLGSTPWNKGKTWDEETLKKLREVDHSYNKTPIIMDNTIYFDGIIDAVSFIGDNARSTSIGRVLTGERKSYRGHTFKYAK